MWAKHHIHLTELKLNRRLSGFILKLIPILVKYSIIHHKFKIIIYIYPLVATAKWIYYGTQTLGLKIQIHKE